MPQLLDITDELFGSLSAITNNQVVQNPLFDLLEGTRAVEIANAKLDTGLIAVSDDDRHFDPSAPRTPSQVLAVMSRLIIGYYSWLNNSSLPVTVLSCRYVQTMLENYSSTVGSLRQRCSFQERRKSVVVPDNSLEYGVVHRVLLPFVMGLTRFIGFTLAVAMEVLYEEEDITTRNMNLNYLQAEPLQLVAAELDAAIMWVATSTASPKDKSDLTQYLQMGRHLLLLESVLEIRLDVLNGRPASLPANFLVDAIACATSLPLEFDNVPQGSFSQFIQLDMGNRNIPIKLYAISAEIARKELVATFCNIKQFVASTANCATVSHLANYLKYDVSVLAPDFNALVRGIFQLFIIRDDKSVLGSSVMFDQLAKQLIEAVVGTNTSLLLPVNCANLSAAMSLEVNQKLAQFITDVESGIHHNLLVYGNNRCRQQQLRNRGIVVWDTLQTNGEALETDLFELSIGDDLMDGSASLPVSSYIFYTKLKVMIDLLVRGIDLELYKDYEMFMVMWYAHFLSQIQLEFIKGRIRDIIASKINHITATLPKRAKKLKGEKKAKARDQLAALTATQLPQLEALLHHHDSYTIPHAQIFNTMYDGIKHMLLAFHAVGAIDFLHSTKNSMTSFEHSFYFRLKPWSSVGVPQLPTFDHYKRTLTLGATPQVVDSLIDIARDKFNLCRKLVKQISLNVGSDAINDHFLPSSANYALEQLEQLGRMSAVYSIELSKIQAGVQVEFTKGEHPFLPRINVTSS